jgi:putative Holliday junction resolvase
MAICNPTELTQLVRKGARLLGLDVGTKTIGMALSDTTMMLATPYDTIRRTRFRDDAQRLVAEIQRHQVGGIVVGLPLALDGREGPRTQGVRQFARNLLAVTDLPLAFWDERLSTAAVNRMLIGEADTTRARRANLVDKAAAAWILQGALDRLRSSPPA